MRALPEKASSEGYDPALSMFAGTGAVLGRAPVGPAPAPAPPPAPAPAPAPATVPAPAEGMPAEVPRAPSEALPVSPLNQAWGKMAMLEGLAGAGAPSVAKPTSLLPNPATRRPQPFTPGGRMVGFKNPMPGAPNPLGAGGLAYGGAKAPGMGSKVASMSPGGPTSMKLPSAPSPGAGTVLSGVGSFVRNNWQPMALGAGGALAAYGAHRMLSKPKPPVDEEEKAARELSPEEEQDVEQNSSRLFANALFLPSTPLPQTMSSPPKGGILGALVGGGVGGLGGAALGAHLGERFSENRSPGAATVGALLGAGLGAAGGGALGYFGRKRWNADARKAMTELPEGATFGDHIAASTKTAAGAARPAWIPQSVSKVQLGPVTRQSGRFSSKGRLKAAAEVVNGGPISSGVANTVGHVGSLLNLGFLMTPDVHGDPRKNRKAHEERVRQFEEVRPQELGDVKVRLGGTDLGDDLKRVFTNQRTGPIGKVLGTLSAPIAALTTPLTRGSHYNPHSNTVVQYADSLPITEHELGHAIDFNKTPVPKGFLARQWAGTKRDAYGLLYANPLLRLWHEGKANTESASALQDALKHRPDELAEARHERWKTLPVGYGSYVGNAAKSIGLPGSTALGMFAGKGVGLVADEYLKHQRKRQEASTAGDRDGDGIAHEKTKNEKQLKMAATVLHRPLSPEEEADVEASSSRLMPDLIIGAGTPLPRTMASPRKGAILGALAGGGLGGAAGYGLGAMAESAGVPGGRAGGALLGAGLGAMGGGAAGYLRRHRWNEDARDLMSRLPEGATYRDYMADSGQGYEGDQLQNLRAMRYIAKDMAEKGAAARFRGMDLPMQRLGKAHGKAGQSRDSSGRSVRVDFGQTTRTKYLPEAPSREELTSSPVGAAPRGDFVRALGAASRR